MTPEKKKATTEATFNFILPEGGGVYLVEDLRYASRFLIVSSEGKVSKPLIYTLVISCGSRCHGMPISRDLTSDFWDKVGAVLFHFSTSLPIPPCVASLILGRISCWRLGSSLLASGVGPSVCH
jgi:hypothetical protein